MAAIDDLIETVAALRDPETGCPWDIEQDHQSLAECLVDECCELLQTIDRADIPHMEEELGDVLLQVVMHAQLAGEAGHFDFEGVCALVNEKLVRRHPHVFGENTDIKGSDAVLKQWDAIKAEEKKRGPEQKGRFKDLPQQLPALMYAKDVFKQIQKQEMKADHLLDNGSIRDCADSFETEEELGQKLFEIAAACRLKKLDPESALRRHAQGIVDALEGEST
ncbi:MazG family protein [Coraliomargarita sinensis]|uniref:MazG family protein n=1 Tax=Coraliomargarita sinensis TaxID=2174842 RepID=A0A317ZMX6_9BACT|nr:MazG family protein [Coraliomargarita sinensis]PXA04761.1 MazG family protein [Coraliomargarita sinensis]